MRPRVGLEKFAGFDGLANGTAGETIWLLLFARLFHARAIVDDPETVSCELSLSQTIMWSQRGRECPDAGSRVLMTGALALFKEKSGNRTTVHEEAKVAVRVESGFAARE